jgi:hypothetical protein
MIRGENVRVCVRVCLWSIRWYSNGRQQASGIGIGVHCLYEYAKS